MKTFTFTFATGSDIELNATDFNEAMTKLERILGDDTKSVVGVVSKDLIQVIEVERTVIKNNKDLLDYFTDREEQAVGQSGTNTFSRGFKSGRLSAFAELVQLMDKGKLIVSTKS